MNQEKRSSQPSYLETCLATGIVFCISLFIALPHGFRTRIGGINIANNSSPEVIRKAWGPSDAGSLLESALTWSKFRQLNPSSQYWIVHLWTPGLSVIEVPLIWLAKIGLPIFWSMLLLTLVLWLTLFFVWWRFFAPIIGRLPLALIVGLVVTSWDYKYILHDDLFFTEGISIALLILGLTLLAIVLLDLEITHKYTVSILSGLLLGTSIMVRHVSDSGLLLLSIFAVLLLLRKVRISGLRNWRRLLNFNIPNFIHSIRNSNFYPELALSISAVVAFLVTLPWRVISPLVYGGAVLTLSTGSSLEAHQMWLPDSSPVIKFWGWTGINWPCKIDALACQKLQPLANSNGSSSKLLLASLKAMLTHPLKFTENRFHFLSNTWIPGGIGKFTSFSVINSMLIPTIFITCLIYSVVRLNGTFWISGGVWLAFLLGQVLQLTVIHFESRYFIPVRELMIGYILMVLMTRQRLRKAERL